MKSCLEKQTGMTLSYFPKSNKDLLFIIVIIILNAFFSSFVV